jgi:hypothetical protein
VRERVLERFLISKWKILAKVNPKAKSQQTSSSLSILNALEAFLEALYSTFCSVVPIGTFSASNLVGACIVMFQLEHSDLAPGPASP